MAANVKITYRYLFGAQDRSRDFEVIMDDTGHQVALPAPPAPAAPPAPGSAKTPPITAVAAPASVANAAAASPPVAAVAPSNAASLHAWTALEHQKCSHCPLKSSEHPDCPVAKNLALVADDFKNEKSYEKVTVEVVSAERTYRKQLPLQEGLFGLFGLIMATSDCPYFVFLRPMARFHLPFSTLKETTVRSISFYLLRQYFVAKAGGTPDMTLAGFNKAYKDLEQVNLGMINRIRSLTKADAEANSIVILDGFGKLLAHSVDKGLPDLEKMFAS